MLLQLPCRAFSGTFIDELPARHAARFRSVSRVIGVAIPNPRRRRPNMSGNQSIGALSVRYWRVGNVIAVGERLVEGERDRTQHKCCGPVIAVLNAAEAKN